MKRKGKVGAFFVEWNYRGGGRRNTKKGKMMRKSGKGGSFFGELSFKGEE